MSLQNIEQEPEPEVERNYVFREEPPVQASDISLLSRERYNSKERVTLRGLLIKLLNMIVDAAVTIFSVGVGVGMILGDTFRETSSNMERTVHSDTRASTNDGSRGDSGIATSLGERVLGTTRSITSLPSQ